ncbi:glycosyltransferase family 4 protein [bacterium]|nr:glycosyltransferase family 4 protein [bacterium]
MADFKGMRIALMGLYPPPYGGISIMVSNLFNALKRENASLLLFNTRASRNTRKHGSFFYRLIRFFTLFVEILTKINSFDILYIHTPSGTSFIFVACLWIWLGKLLGKRVAVTYHGARGARFLPRLGRFGAFFLRLADRVSTPSAHLDKYFARYKITNALVIPNFLEESIFKCDTREKATPNLLNVIKRGGRGQNTGTLLNIFRGIKKKLPDATLTLIGYTPEKERFLKLVKGWGLEGVDFKGPVPYPEMPGIYQQADIFINIPEFESFGLTIVEALLSGLPVIATAVGGVPQVLEHGEGGFMVDKSALIEISKYVIELTEKPEFYNQTARKALKRGKQFTWKQTRERYYRLLAG